jgi:hypothetical protein
LRDTALLDFYIRKIRKTAGAVDNRYILDNHSLALPFIWIAHANIIVESLLHRAAAVRYLR